MKELKSYELREKYLKILALDIPLEKVDECERNLRIIEGELRGSKKDI